GRLVLRDHRSAATRRFGTIRAGRGRWSGYGRTRSGRAGARRLTVSRPFFRPASRSPLTKNGSREMTEIDTIPSGGGRTIAFRRAGQGPAVVLLHGITETGAIFEPLIERLRDGREVIVPDLAGHGDSFSPQVVSLDDIVADVARLIERLKLAAPLVVGHAY